MATQKAKRLRVLGYLRLSRASDDSTSVAKQRDIITKTAEARGFELIDIVDKDDDVSASKSRLNRPGLREVRERIAAGEADAVLVWRLDRLARSVVDMGTLLDEGLQVVSATEPLDTTSPMGRAMVEILQVFAALEARTTGQRLKDTKTYLRTIDRWAGGQRPYGYRPEPAPDGVGKVLAVDHDEAATVRRICDAIIAGHSLYSIAVQLNTDGVPAAKGGRWTRGQVRNVARSEAILGRVVAGGRVLLDDEGRPRTPWPALVELETATRVRELTEETPTPGRSAATIAGRRKRASRLLSGMLACACGAPLVVRRRRGLPYYGCSSIARGTAHDGPSILVDAERAEAAFIDQWLKVVGDLEVVELIEHRPAVAGLAEAEREIAELTAEMRNVGPDELPQLFERLRAISSRREALQAETSEPTTETVYTGETFRQRWDRDDDLVWRRKLVETSGVLVSILPARRRGFWDAERVSVTFSPEDYLAGQLD